MLNDLTLEQMINFGMGIIFITVLFVLSFYVLQSYSVMKIAQKSGLYDESWMAWLPVANSYLLGKIAEKNNPVERNNYSMIMLCLAAGSIVLGFIPFIGFLVAIASAVYSFICYYEIFKIANPNKAMMRIVLSIIFGIMLPIFLFISSREIDG